VFPWLSMPKGRMGPPLRSFAADAHDCIMVRVLGPTVYKVVARLIRAPQAGSPLIVIPIAPSVPSCSELSRCGLATAEHAARLVRRPTLTAPARADLSEARVGTKKRALRSNKETDEGRKMRRPAETPTSRIQGNRAGGTYAVAARSTYGDLRTARNLNGRRFSTAVGLEHEHNLDVTARILLNGDLSFRPTCDFKELGVAEMSRAIPFKL
jgi:hypothetical protein